MPVETRLQRKRRLQREIVKLQDEPTWCAICLGTLWCWNRCTTSCTHVFHRSCLADWLAINPTCPLCRTHLTLPESTWAPWLAAGLVGWWLC